MTENDRGKGIGTMTALGIGAALGAIAVVFANRDTREKAQKKYSEIKGQGKKMLEKAEDKTRSLKEKAEDKVGGLRDKAEDKKEEVSMEMQN